mgnify:CR=1 FL=1
MILIIGLVAFFQFNKHFFDPGKQRKEKPRLSNTLNDLGPPPVNTSDVVLNGSPHPEDLGQDRRASINKKKHQASGATVETSRRTGQPTNQTIRSLPNYKGTGFKQETGDFPFYVAEKRWDPKKRQYDFLRKGMQGTESQLRIDARRYFISEDQSNYPEPASGCGPTALLNLYVWYSKFGLLKESVKHSNFKTYKQLKFRQVDRKILDIQRESRTRHGGTNTLAAIVAMDELVQQNAKTPTRLHFEIKRPPLTRSDFTALSRNYRVGLLSVRPKNPRTGRLMGNHAVVCIRGDTSGMITIANWGDFSHGNLVKRGDGQWFIPKDATQQELRINTLTLLIPFTPRS